MSTSASAVRLYSAPPRAMSRAAERIVLLSGSYQLMMQQPERSPWADRRLFETEENLRAFAHDYITQATTDLDFHAFLSREAAAGRRFSSTLARGAFFQAGVVAPPESLIYEKTPGFGGC